MEHGATPLVTDVKGILSITKGDRLESFSGEDVVHLGIRHLVTCHRHEQHLIKYGKRQAGTIS